MQNNEYLVYPLLSVTIQETEVKARPAHFRLMTDRGMPSIGARLDYSSGVEVGSPGDSITVALIAGTERHLLLTGSIYDAHVHGAYRTLLLTDGYKQLCDTPITPAYRKEKAPVIVQDTLDAAGITETAITCPQVELARFSLDRISGDRCIALLINALLGYNQQGIRYFFDAHNTFHFGSIKDTGKNEGEPYAFETGKHILRTGPGWIELLPHPIRHSQTITLDGTDMITQRTELVISPHRSRIKLWVGEA